MSDHAAELRAAITAGQESVGALESKLAVFEGSESVEQRELARAEFAYEYLHGMPVEAKFWTEAAAVAGDEAWIFEPGLMARDRKRK